MPIALWCVLAAAILPALSALPAKIDRAYDNANPRDPGFWGSGFRTRVAGAMANGFEAFPLFAVAVLVALWRGDAAGVVDGLAVLYVAVRLGYIAAYWADRASLRSLLWSVALVVAIAIFLTPVWAPAPL